MNGFHAQMLVWSLHRVALAHERTHGSERTHTHRSRLSACGTEFALHCTAQAVELWCTHPTGGELSPTAQNAISKALRLYGWNPSAADAPTPARRKDGDPCTKYTTPREGISAWTT